MLERIGVLSVSKKELNEKHKLKPMDNETHNTYFMVINPNQLKAMVDAIFSKF